MEEKYPWKITFHMKSGNSLKALYLTESISVGEVTEEIVQNTNKGKSVWLGMNTENPNIKVAVNLSEVEAFSVTL